MDTQITIQRASSQTLDANGYPVPNWTDLYAGVWAEVRVAPGREMLGGPGGIPRIQSSQTASFFTWYFDGITVKDRIVHAGKNWNIRSVRELGRRDGLELVAELQE